MRRIVSYLTISALSTINVFMAAPQEILTAAKDKDFELAGCGLFAQVLVLIEAGITLKICDEPGEASVVERKIYERLGPHPRILTTSG